MCQILNFKEHELKMLANFMAHDVRVHRTFYRLPHDAFQTSLIAKAFFMMETSTITKHDGKTLEEIVLSVKEGEASVSKYF
jgi:hypothetical protein